MSNAIAQSATQLSVSPNGEAEFSFQDSVRRQAERTAKGTTRERQLLSRNKLVSATCADYRMHFPAIYGKTERLPSEVFGKIEAAVDSFLSEQFNRVNVNNALSLRRSFYHNSKEMEVSERIQLTGENKLTLKEQLFGCTMFISQAEKRLKELEAKPTPDYDREKAIKQQIMQLNLTKSFITGEIEHQSKLSANETSPK
jgi:hypothetical protein